MRFYHFVLSSYDLPLVRLLVATGYGKNNPD
ncbi:hypothetical protein Nmel_001768 [Mimus melanotis]